MFGVKKSKILPKLINSFLIILLIFIFTKISLFGKIFFQNTSLYDFDLYYSLSENIKNGVNPYSPHLTFSLGPPLVFLYFFPFSFFDLPTARILATTVNIVSGFFLCFLLAKKFNKKYLLTTFLCLSILFFSSFLPRFSLGMGQPSILLTLLVTLVIVSKNSFWKGVLLAITASIKTIFIFPITSFVKNKKVIFSFLLAIIFLLLLSLVFIKPEWYVYYFQTIFSKLNSSPVFSSGLDYYNQSLKSTFYRLGIIDSYKYLFYPILAIISGVIAAVGSFELSAIMVLLLSPVSWQHYFTVLFPIFIVVVFRMEKGRKNFFLLMLSFFLWFFEFPQLHTMENSLINGISASHYFFSGLLLFFLVWRSKHLIGS